MYEWFVVGTEYQREKTCWHGLTMRGVRNLYPMLRTERRRKIDGLLQNKLEPLFPGYLFVCIRWKHMDKVLGVKGFKEFIGFREGMEKPIPVRRKEIEALRSNLTEYLGYDVLKESCPIRIPIERDSLVKILFGPFQNFEARASAVDGSDVTVLLSLFGKQFEQTFDEDELEAVA